MLERELWSLLDEGGRFTCLTKLILELDRLFQCQTIENYPSRGRCVLRHLVQAKAPILMLRVHRRLMRVLEVVSRVDPSGRGLVGRREHRTPIATSRAEECRQVLDRALRLEALRPLEDLALHNGVDTHLVHV